MKTMQDLYLEKLLLTQRINELRSGKLSDVVLHVMPRNLGKSQYKDLVECIERLREEYHSLSPSFDDGKR
ncbi:hypothetical protein [Vibrio barjaei]|uniref:hypothetical protein n=1 Tax=Vibrio barjaei TaxID=1676683 RepID=UPI002283A234|nr:hypothetical protein [Vibrio barjaei]MCY9874069.1 hypothetical protein [Vibrio barjaei]